MIKTLTKAILAGAVIAAVIPIPAQAATTQILYVYSTDTAARDSYATFITSRGYDFETITEDELATGVPLGVDLIVVGADTFYGYNPFTGTWGWATPQALTQVAEATIPVIGVGTGGSGLLSSLGSDVGYDASWDTTATGVTAVTPDSNIWQGVQEPANLMSSAVPTVAASEGRSNPRITYVGRQIGAARHYPVAIEALGSRSVALWGFEGSPASMTADGKTLFGNVIASMTGDQGLLQGAHGDISSPPPATDLHTAPASGSTTTTTDDTSAPSVPDAGVTVPDSPTTVEAGAESAQTTVTTIPTTPTDNKARCTAKRRFPQRRWGCKRR